MDYRIIWTETAVANLTAIVQHVALDNPTAARKLGEDILAHAEILATFPHIGPAYPRGSTAGVRQVMCRNYRMFYRVMEERITVEILLIWHGARQDPALPSRD